METCFRNLLYEYGKKLRAIRKAIGLAQFEAARVIGIDPGNLSKIENGKINPSLVTIINILDAYGFKMCFVLDVDDLLSYKKFVTSRFDVDSSF